MMAQIAALTGGTSLSARALRSAALVVGGFGTSQAIRLASNLILTRLLFPEAFGLMALVAVFMQGLAMFSDVGVTPSIMQSKRGDDQDFLDTAWTIQVIRGIALWCVAAGLAWPMAQIYGAPELVLLIPAASLTLILNGFNPTRLETANRHLRLGRVTAIDIGTQLAGIASAVVLAWLWQSVWALVVSGIVSAAVQLVLLNACLPGKANRLRWEKAAVDELVGFGKWIFLSTVCGFAASQGDKVVLGKLLTLEVFGVYNIGYFLASFPLLLGSMVTRKLLIPIYREKPPRESAANFAHLRKMRLLVSLALMGLLAGFSFLGVWLVQLLYDPRYMAAGAVVVVIALTQIPRTIALTYDQAALAQGDSRRFFVLALARAVFMLVGLVAGFQADGLFGALVGQGAAHLAAYPVTVWLARRMGAWDPLHDAAFAALGVVIAFIAVWLNYGEVLTLAIG